MKTIFSLWLAGLAFGFCFVIAFQVLGPLLWYPLYCRLSDWLKRHRPHWPTAKRRWDKRKHLRHMIALAFRFNVLVTFAWLGGFGLTVYC